VRPILVPPGSCVSLVAESRGKQLRYAVAPVELNSLKPRPSSGLRRLRQRAVGGSGAVAARSARLLTLHSGARVQTDRQECELHPLGQQGPSGVSARVQPYFHVSPEFRAERVTSRPEAPLERVVIYHLAGHAGIDTTRSQSCRQPPTSCNIWRLTPHQGNLISERVGRLPPARLLARPWHDDRAALRQATE
jgi:hypothetical protein